MQYASLILTILAHFLFRPGTSGRRTLDVVSRLNRSSDERAVLSSRVSKLRMLPTSESSVRLCICWRPEVSHELKYSGGCSLTDRPSLWLSAAAVSLAVAGLGREKRV